MQDRGRASLRVKRSAATAVIAVYSVNLAWCSAAISCRRTLLWDLDAAGGARCTGKRARSTSTGR
jgi:hypothetical protein